MQAKIATARRDAEGLKDKIKRKKDELADTSQELEQYFDRDREPLGYACETRQHFCEQHQHAFFRGDERNNCERCSQYDYRAT